MELMRGVELDHTLVLRAELSADAEASWQCYTLKALLRSHL
jgi:hypothetical protein